MRTLKKSLALVLALVMVLGLGVIGASADNALDNYTDASEIGDAYYEAVGVLTGLGIIDGMTETTIEPTGTYTREQAAKIIATMVLGVKNAESLTCVEAPFDDVPADRWSAGYIAFCVEQGIIDGMTDTTFEPTGTLTGFQWAKMLLAAVGFGANGEFTGTSWSLNTARVAHEAGLFTGDLSGADHVNLSRQQAALYAFNTLTEIKQVSYSANNDNYIYGLAGYEWLNQFGSWWADGTGYTLGESVFNLVSDEGIVVGTEGTGEDATILSVDYTDSAASIVEDRIDADLDAYMLYHGARIWSVVGGTSRNPSYTAVFVYDLSKVTTLECPSDKAVKELLKGVKDLKDDLNVGSKSTYTDRYEAALIDNSAVNLPAATNNNAYVEYWAELSKLGVSSETKDTTVIPTGGVEPPKDAIDNDNIWTDISELGKGDGIVVLKANTNYGANTDTIYYVYATSTTVGEVEDIEDNGVITLTDGTVLAPSVFMNDVDKIEAIYDIMMDPYKDGPRYAFDLDSHGHWYDYNNSSLKSVAYWTGDVAVTSEHGALTHDITYDALFARVSDGEIVRVPVTNTWLKSEWKNIVNWDGTFTGAYYDITDELYGNATYSPEEVFVANNDTVGSYGAFRYADQLVVGSNTYIFKDKDGKSYIFEPETVQYYVASGYGSKLDVADFTGNDGLIAGVSEATGVDVSSVTLKNVAVLTVEEAAGNRAVTVIFGYNGIDSAVGGILFLPEGLAPSDWKGATDSYARYYKGVYRNGVELSKDDNIIRVKSGSDLLSKIYTPGFYNYTIDGDGYVTKLEKIDNADWGNYTGANLISKAGEFYVLGFGVNSINSGKGYVLADDVVVKDVRTGEGEEYDGINAVVEFFDDNAEETAPLNIVYVLNSSDKVQTIYVVDANNYTVGVKFEKDPDNWGDNTSILINDAAGPVQVSAWGDRAVTIKIVNAGGHGDIAFSFTVTAGDYTKTIHVENYASADGATFSEDHKVLSFNVPVDGDCTVVVSDWT